MLYLYLLPILLPMAAGGAVFALRKKKDVPLRVFALCSVVCTSVLVFILLFLDLPKVTLFSFSSGVDFGFALTPIGKIFAGMVSFLWPFALLYAFEYLKEDPRKNLYFSFYTATFGTVLGIAFASDALTLYVFYELLTFVTLPLILHTQTKEARKAGRTYLYYSLSGSALALCGIVMVTVISGSNAFIPGGYVTTDSALSVSAYLFMFFGFGVKAAVLPGSLWLPAASAAPTPTTALLHAVAVVKSGAFAILQVTYFLYEPQSLRGSAAQIICMCAAALTVVYGSVRAIAEMHFKRRFAFSTISNLSYILVGGLLCSEAGLISALLHFLYHSITKIGIFFSIGAIHETTGANYLYEINGFGKKMPRQFAIFTVLSLSLVGVPCFAGFVSKYYLLRAGLSLSGFCGAVGAAAILFSAVCTAVYCFSVLFRAYVREPNEKCKQLFEDSKEPSRNYLILCALFAVLCVVFGVWSGGVLRLLTSVVGGSTL